MLHVFAMTLNRPPCAMYDLRHLDYFYPSPACEIHYKNSYTSLSNANLFCFLSELNSEDLWLVKGYINAPQVAHLSVHPGSNITNAYNDIHVHNYLSITLVTANTFLHFSQTQGLYLMTLYKYYISQSRNTG